MEYSKVPMTEKNSHPCFFRIRFLPAALVVFPCEITDEEVTACAIGALTAAAVGSDDATVSAG